MNKHLFILLLLPFAVLSQSAVIKPFYLVHSNDSIKSISYPVLYTSGMHANRRINNIIKASVFHGDTSKPLQKLLQTLYKKDNELQMQYTVNRNKNGFLSIIITRIPSKGDKIPPIYLNFDLAGGNLITLGDIFKSKDDSFSFRQAVVPAITDSIQLVEQTINKSNPNYGKIIEWLNSSLNTFWYSYTSKYILTDKEIIVCFDCFIPHNLLPYNHTYRATFPYKIIKNIFKEDVIKRLTN
jgi:hypothetical protein